MNDIQKMAQNLEADLVKFVRELVAIPSVCGHEEQVIKRIHQEMIKIGYEEIRTDNMGNLFGRMGSGNRIIAIDGHCDTVDTGNPDNWSMGPFSAEIKDGMIFGRGACDQKGGLACAVYSARILQEIGLPNNLSLWVVASVQEEDCEGLSWKYMIEEDNFRPDAVLLTEPSDLKIMRGHRGRLEMKVKTEGISSHGSAPERGENAIFKMIPLVGEIQRLHQRLKSDDFLGKGSLTLTDIRSTAPSLCAVPDSCTIHLDRRLTVGETIETSMNEVRGLPSFQNAGARIWVPEYRAPSYKGHLFPMKSFFPSWVLDEDHQLVQTAIRCYKEQFNKAPIVDKWMFSTNGVTTMGMHQIPTIGFGPGEEKYAHSPDERVQINQLVQALAFYADFVHHFE